MISHFNLGAAVAWAVDVVEPAAAAPGNAAQPSTMMAFMPMILIIVVMYFLMIRPQQKKQKEHQTMLAAIQKGDKVQTSGGLLGTVTALEPNELTVEIAPQVRVKVGRGFITRVIRPGDHSPAEKKS